MFKLQNICHMRTFIVFDKTGCFSGFSGSPLKMSLDWLPPKMHRLFPPLKYGNHVRFNFPDHWGAGGGQSGPLMFFWNRSIIGQHLAKTSCTIHQLWNKTPLSSSHLSLTWNVEGLLIKQAECVTVEGWESFLPTARSWSLWNVLHHISATLHHCTLGYGGPVTPAKDRWTECK